MKEEPLTEAVGDTQLAMPAVQAWSEEAEDYRGRDWRVRDDWPGFLKYVMPVVLVVTVLSFVFGGGHRSESPVVAPPTSAVVVPPTSLVPPPAPPLPETTDEKFVAALINHGAEITQSKAAVHNAHAVCDDLAHGTDRTLIANDIKNAVDGYTDERAAIFVSLSARFYCPQYAA